MLFYPVRFKGCRAARAGAARAPPAAQHPADPRRHAGRRRLAGDHPVARGEDGLHRRRQGDREARQRRRLLRAARARGDRRAHPRHRRAATSATSSSARWSASTRAVERPAAAGPRGRARSASRSSCPTSCATVTDEIGDEHRPAARRQADGHPADRGAPRAGQPDLPRGRRARSCASSSTSASSSASRSASRPRSSPRSCSTQWWLLPIGGVIIGYVDQPAGDQDDLRAGRAAAQFGPFKVHGLFLRRQPEVAEVYAEIIADDIVTIANIGEELLHGPRSDRTRHMIETAMRPAVDRAVRPARSGRARGRRHAASTTRSASRWPSRRSTTR